MTNEPITNPIKRLDLNTFGDEDFLEQAVESQRPAI